MDLGAVRLIKDLANNRLKVSIYTTIFHARDGYCSRTKTPTGLTREIAGLATALHAQKSNVCKNWGPGWWGGRGEVIHPGGVAALIGSY